MGHAPTETMMRTEVDEAADLRREYLADGYPDTEALSRYAVLQVAFSELMERPLDQDTIETLTDLSAELRALEDTLTE